MTEAEKVGALAFDRPEASTLLIGHEDAERVLLDSYRSGRVPHAWLIDGPAGVGKATLVYRFARFVLAFPDPTDERLRHAEDLGLSGENVVARQIAARAHPNLIVLERPRDEEGRISGMSIPVEAVRRLGRFLGTTAAGGNWRIVVVDACDDLRREAANALLKMLEEPPDRTLFLLVAHVRGRVLPTICSRCRRLSLKPLSDTAVGEALEKAAIGDNSDDRALAARLAQGSLGRAVEIIAEEGGETARAVIELLEALPDEDAVRMQSLAERLGGRSAQSGYRLAGSLMLDWIAARARAAAREGTPPAQLAPWSQVWDKVSRALAETEIYNLDRTQTLLMAFRSVSAAAVQDAARA